ncbi:hypothetical protein QCI42_07290 [Bacillus fungorum]|uniref:hypothetical protein n=1 Tax=Bacillus fungorum TaxID=2039284 RepID=UPI00339B7FC7
MKLDLYLCDTSFNYRIGEEHLLTKCVFDLDDVVKKAKELGEDIYVSYSWYNQIIKEDIAISSWLYEYSEDFSNQDEKMLMNEIIKQTKYIEDEEYLERTKLIKENSQKNGFGAILCLFLLELCDPPQNFNIYNKQDYINIHRFYLHQSNSIEELFHGFQGSFPNLYCSESVLKSMKTFKPLHDYKGEIIKHLAILNDEGYKLYQEYNSSQDKEIIKKLESSGLECSGQGDSNYQNKYLSFTFLNDRGKEEVVVCAPHTKLFHKGSDYRIYFARFNSTIKNGEKLLIGHIGDHC